MAGYTKIYGLLAALAWMTVGAVGALAVEVTPLSGEAYADSASQGLLNGDAASGNWRGSTRNPHPEWVFVGLLPEKTWETWGLRPPAFAVTGTRPFDPASAPVMVMPRSKSGSGSSKSGSAAGKGAGTSGTSGGTSSSGPTVSGTAPAKTQATSGSGPTGTPARGNGAMGTSGPANGSPYSGSAPATGTVSEPSQADTGADVLHPATGGVTHTRAPSATQTDAALSNKPATIPERPAAGTSYPAPQTARKPSVAGPVVLPPNNGMGALDTAARTN